MPAASDAAGVDTSDASAQWVPVSGITVEHGGTTVTYSLTELELNCTDNTATAWFDDVNELSSRAIPLPATITADGLTLHPMPGIETHTQLVRTLDADALPLTQTTALLTEHHETITRGMPAGAALDPVMSNDDYVALVHLTLTASQLPTRQQRVVALAMIASAFTRAGTFTGTAAADLVAAAQAATHTPTPATPDEPHLP